jgi:hypothetical protein
MWELWVPRIPGGFLKVGHDSGISSPMHQCYIACVIVNTNVEHRNTQTGLYLVTATKGNSFLLPYTE